MRIGTKLSLEKKNLRNNKLSYIYKKGLNTSIKRSIVDIFKNNKIYLERNITGFDEVKSVKEEWKSRFINKQLLKTYYNLTEKEYKNLKDKIYGERLIEKLEKRIDVILFRLGWTKSIEDSNNYIKKGEVYKIKLEEKIKINNRKEEIKEGWSIILNNNEENIIKNKIEHILSGLYNKVSWIKEINGKGYIIGEPKIEEIKLPINLNTKKLGRR